MNAKMTRARNVLGAIVSVINEKWMLFWMVNIDIPSSGLVC